MKKAFYAAAALLMLAGCSKEQQGEIVSEKGKKTIEISLVQTRATISDNGSGAASFAWEEGDKIGVQVDDKLVEFELTEFDGSKAKFQADVTGELKDGAYVAYPYVPEDCIDGVFKVSYPSVYEVDKADAFRLRWSGTLKEDTENGGFYTELENTAAIFRVTYATVPDFAQAVTMKVDDADPVTVKFTQDKVENMNFYFPVLEGEYDAITVALATEEGEEIDGTAQTITKKNGKLSLAKGKIYRTPVITLNLYELVNDAEQLEAGDYVLAYYNGNGFNLFSFSKSMENAVAAADLLKDVHGLSNIFAQGSAVYSTALNGNYVSVSGKEGALAINVPTDAEEAAMFSATGNATSGKVTFSSGDWTLRADKLIIEINSDNSAIVSAQLNAEDLVSIAKKLRGTEIPVTFQNLIDFAVEQAQKEGVTFTPEQIDRLKSGFEHLCRLAKSVVKEKLGKDMMTIDLSTEVLDVFARYYDNVCDYSLQISSEKKFGWATPIGFYKGDNGFTANLALPNYGWFTRLEDSLKGTKDECVAYWGQFDDDYQILDFDNFFSRAANRALRELDDSTYEMLRQMANEGKFSLIGNVYKKYAERINDDLEPVYIYKKVQ